MLNGSEASMWCQGAGQLRPGTYLLYSPPFACEHIPTVADVEDIEGKRPELFAHFPDTTGKRATGEREKNRHSSVLGAKSPGSFAC